MLDEGTERKGGVNKPPTIPPPGLSPGQGGRQPYWDDPTLDCTDGAHPAWWRAHDYTADKFCQLVSDILDGKDDGRGVCAEPWESVRRRLFDLVAEASA